MYCITCIGPLSAATVLDEVSYCLCIYDVQLHTDGAACTWKIQIAFLLVNDKKII